MTNKPERTHIGIGYTMRSQSVKGEELSVIRILYAVRREFDVTLIYEVLRWKLALRDDLPIAQNFYALRGKSNGGTIGNMIRHAVRDESAGIDRADNPQNWRRGAATILDAGGTLLRRLLTAVVISVIPAKAGSQRI